MSANTATTSVILSNRDRHSTSITGLLRSFFAHRELIWQLTRREVIGRYRGSMMGLLWSLFNPLLMLAVYTFVFGIVFKSRWTATPTGISDTAHQGQLTPSFALVLFSGMIVYGLFAELMNRAPQLILNSPNYVKKVVFPLEILPWVALGSGLFHLAVSLAVLLVFSLALTGSLPWTVFLFPIVIIPLVLLVLGLSWFLAALGVYVRDISQAIGIITSVFLFLSPVFYPVSALPEKYRPLLYFNPLTGIIEQTREVLLWGNLPDLRTLGILTLVGLSVAALGFAWFQRTRKGFGDVI